MAVIALSADNFNNMIFRISSGSNDISYFKVMFNFLESNFDNIDSFDLWKSMKINILIFKLNLIVFDLENFHLTQMIGLLILLRVLLS